MLRFKGMAMVVVLVALALVTAPARAGLLNYWAFDNASNVGQATVGTDVTAGGDAQHTAAGQSGGGLALDGSGDYLGGAPTLPTGDSPYSTSAWIKPTATGGRGIAGWGNYGSSRQVNAFRLNGDNGFRHYWWGADIDRNADPVDLDDGNWHHVATNYDGVVRSLWVDGQPIGSDTPGNNSASAANFRIGSTNNGEYFQGTIDGVAIYDNALTGNQLAHLAGGGDPQALPAPSITVSPLLVETDLVNTGLGVVAAANFGGTGEATVNGIVHADSNSTYAPVDFSGPWGDPGSVSGDLQLLLDGIAGTNNGNEPGELTIPGLTPGQDYLFQAYWVVKDSFDSRRLNATLEGDSLFGIEPNSPNGGGVLISFPFTATDDTFNASFEGVGGDNNGWITGFSLQEKAPEGDIPEPATMLLLTAGLGGLAVYRRRKA